MTNDKLELTSLLEANCLELCIEDELITFVIQRILDSHSISPKMATCVCLSGRNCKKTRMNDDVMIALCECWEMAKFISLDLSFNNIGRIGIDRLSLKIEEDKYLVRLDLSFNDFEDDGANTFLESLQFNRSLKHLNLSGCKLRLKGGLAVASMLQINRSLEELILSSCDLNTDVLIALATVLYFNQSVRLLDISRTLSFSRQNETTIHLGRMLRVNNNLNDLRISKCGLTDCDIREFCEFIKDNKSLRRIDMSCNKLAQDGAIFLSQLLKFNSTLKQIDLTANMIEDPGLISLSEVIRSYNSTLEILKIGYNNIGDSGLCHLFNSLLSNNSIISLSIWGNKFGSKTCRTLSSLLDTFPPRFPLDRKYIDVIPYSVDGEIYLAELN